MKLGEEDLRLLLDAVLRRAEAAEAQGANPFAWTKLAQRLRDELMRNK